MKDERAKMKGKLKPCPFCGRKPEILICDDEGDIHDAAYEKAPWNGLSYQLAHPAKDCPLTTFPGEPLGIYEYNSRSEAVSEWNRRAGKGDKKTDLPTEAPSATGDVLEVPALPVLATGMRVRIDGTDYRCVKAPRNQACLECALDGRQHEICLRLDCVTNDVVLDKITEGGAE